MGETSLSSLMKEIGEAVKLDNDNMDKEAYKKYVSCIYKITTNLILAMKLTGGDVVIDSKTSRQVKLVQQCVDRVSALVEKMSTSRSSSAATTPTQPSPAVTPTANHGFSPACQSNFRPQQRTPSTGHPTQGSLPSPSASRSVLSSKLSEQPSPSLDQPDGQHSRFMAVPSLPQERNPYAFSAKSQALTPMQLARKQNQSLMAAYKARMERLNRSDFNAFNYSLTIQRKMAENIAIAHAQEEELARKMQARNLRLEQEAAKRFATPIGMSEEEQEQRQIYKKILAYENDVAWLRNWRNKLESNPEDPILISQLVQEILRCSDHPFTELLHKYQFRIYERLFPLVANKHEELDKIKVPLATDTWPSLDDVSEVLEEGRGFRSPKSPTSPKSPRSTKSPSQKKLKTSKEERKTKDDKQKKDKKSDDRDEEEKSMKNDPRGSNDEDKSETTSHKRTGSSGGNADAWNDPLDVRSDSQTSLRNIDSDEKKNPSVSNKDGSDLVPYDKNSSECDNSSIGKTADAESKESSSNLPGDTDEPEETKGSDSAGEKETDTSDSEDEGNEIEDGKDDSVKECKSDDGKDSGKVSTSKTSDTSSDTVDGATHMAKVVEKTKSDLHLALDKNKELESQLSYERRQAQILMRQVTRDYGSYDKNSDYDDDNLDYLFDEDDDDDEYNCYASAANMSAYHQRFFPSRGDIPQDDSASSPDATTQAQNTGLDRSVSHQPTASRQYSDEEDTRFSSLPIDANQDEVDGERKKFEKLSREAYQRHLRSIADDVHQYLEKLLVMMTIAYEPLDTPVGKDQCAVSLEEPFFKPIWKTLLRLFRAVNHKQELVLACVMTKYADTTPQDMKVSKKFWLTGCESQEAPYQRAITELTRVQDHYTMLSKLECVVKVCRLICECVDDHYKKKDETAEKKQEKKKAPSIGADDLLPILSYVVIHSALPQLGTECLAMTEFIHEGYMMGEEGYCLTTLRTALNYVTSLFPSVVAGNAK